MTLNKHSISATVATLVVIAITLAAPRPALAQEGRTLIVRGDDSYPPYEFIDDAGQPAGYNIDLIRAVAEEAGLEVDVRLSSWRDVVRDLREGRADVVTGMYRSPAREQEFDFSHTHIVVTHSLFARKGSPIRTLDDARGASIIVQDGDIMHDYLLETELTEDIVTVPDQQAALELLAGGEHDCALVGKLQGLFHIHRSGLTHLVMPVGEEILPRDYCFAVRKGDTRLLARLAAGHTAVRTSGLDAEIEARWFPQEAPAVRSQVIKFAAWIGIPLLLLLAGALYWSWSLEREVGRKTREIKRELTERIRIEESIRDREEQLRKIVQNMPVMVFGFDEMGRITAWNAECERVTGYAADEIIGRDGVLETLYPDDDFRSNLEAEWAKRGADYRNWEWAITHKDGSQRIVSWSNISGRMPISGWAHWGTGIDVTWLRDIERTLEYGEDRYRAISDLTSDFAYAFRVDENGTLTAEWVTGALERISGWTKEELKTRGGWEELLLPEDRSVARRQIEQLLAGQAAVVEYRIMTKNAETRWVRDYARPDWDESQGRTTRIVGAVQDITERRAIEENLRRSEALYRMTMDSMHDAVHVVDRELRITLMNRRNREWLAGLDIEVPGVGDCLRDVFSFLDDSVFEQYEQVFDTGETVATEERIRLAHHEVFTETTKIPVIENGTVTRVITIVHDATTRRRMQWLTQVQRDLSIALHPVQSVEESLDRCIRAAFDVSGADAGVVYLAEDGGFRLAASVGHSDDFVRAAEWMASGTAIIDAATDDKEGLFITEADVALAKKPQNDLRGAFQREGATAAALLPIMHEGRLAGLLGVASREVADFPQHAREALRTMASSIGGIVASKRASEALCASEEKFRGLFSTSLEGIVVGTLDGMVVEANPAFLELVGRTMDEIGGVRFSEITPERWHALDEEVNSMVMERGFSEEYEKEYRRADGTLVPVAVRSWLFRDEHGRPSRIWGTVRDITAQKNEELARSVLLNISQAAGGTDTLEAFLHTVRQELGRLMDTTNFYVALYDEETGLYSFPYHADALDDAPVGPIPLENSVTDYVRRTGEPYLIDQRTQQRLEDEQDVTVYGEPSPVWMGMPLTTSRGVFGVVAVQSYDESELYTERELELMRFVSGNISLAVERKKAEEERRGLEEQVRHTQKLESLGVLAGGIAHDFNNLLTGILGNADMALLELNERDPASESVRAIRDTAERAADLSRQMLAYSGRGRFIIEPIEVNEVVSEMSQLLEASLSKSAIVRFDLAESLPLITGDATQIRQVIMNLMTNASDAIGDRNGVISLRTCAVECDRIELSQGYASEELPEGAYVCIEVEDTGVGMDEETASRIFDPFFTTKFTGRGLGLAAVLGIVRAHKGTISVESSAGTGTTIRVLIPVSTEDDAVTAVHEAATESRSPWDAAGGTVLLVDDEPTVRRVTQKMLERAGFDVVTASDGLKAIDAYRKHSANIVCVLLDLTMPNMGGEETFRELRKLDPNLRIILSSGYGEKEITNRFVGKGLAGFIQKPYLAAKLVTKVRDVLSSP